MTHLMFQDGRAREAAELYVSLSPDAQIDSTEFPDGNALVRFTLGGRGFIAFDSPVQHAFGFTPAMSVFLTCDTAEEVDAAFATLSKDGEVLMPIDDYGFSSRFGWCQDRFGVSWQVSLEA